MRKRALSWTAVVIGAVALMGVISGCGGAEGIGVLNAILPGGITEPAAIIPVASGSGTLQDNAGRLYQFANTGGSITLTGDCSGVQVFQSALSGASDPETLAFTGCSGTVQQAYLRLQQPSPLQVDHAWVTGTSGCARHNPSLAMVWELDLAACGVGSTPPSPPNPPSPPQPPSGPSVGGYGLWFDTPPTYGFTIGAACGTLQAAEIKFWKDGSGTELFGGDVSGGCHFNVGLSGTTLSGATINGTVSGKCYAVTSSRIEFYGCGDSGPPDDGGNDPNLAGRFAAGTSMFKVFKDGTIRAHGGSGCAGMPLYYEADDGQSGVVYADAPCTWRLPASILGQNIYIWFLQPDDRKLKGGLCVTEFGGGKFWLSGCFGGGYNPPPSYGSCGGREYDYNGNGRFDDTEIVDAVKTWILTDPPKISDDCIVVFVKKWIRGEQIGTAGDDSPLTEGELTKIRQRLGEFGDRVAEMIIQMESSR